MFTNINPRCGILYKHHVHKTLQYPLPVYFTVSQGSTSMFFLGGGGFTCPVRQMRHKSICPKSIFYLALHISGNQAIHFVISQQTGSQNCLYILKCHPTELLFPGEMKCSPALHLINVLTCCHFPTSARSIMCIATLRGEKEADVWLFRYFHHQLLEGEKKGGYPYCWPLYLHAPGLEINFLSACYCG